MAVHDIGLRALSGPLLELVRPLLGRRPPTLGQMDRALKEADSQARPPAKPKGCPMVAHAVGVAHIVRLDATPPLAWDGAGYRCGDEPTRLVITCTDGSRHELELVAGTRLPVAGGLLHVPPPPASAPE